MIKACFYDFDGMCPDAGWEALLTMRRNMQNISFVTLVSVLLSCAFFFSQQTGDPSSKTEEAATPVPTVETLEDLPECPEDGPSEAAAACYAEAAIASGQMVAAQADAILALETDSGKRMAFVESQQSWEESRDADCAFAGELAAEPAQQEIAENACLRDHNVDRFSQLEAIRCEYYAPASCGGEIDP